MFQRRSREKGWYIKSAGEIPFGIFRRHIIVILGFILVLLVLTVLETQTVLFPAQLSGFLPSLKKPLKRGRLNYFGLLFLLIALNGFVSCKSGVVLGIPRNEVLERLKNQDIDFILKADIAKMSELRKLHPSAPFYAGLLVKAAGDSLRAEVLFEEALKSPSDKVRTAAAEQLLPLLVKKNSDSSLLSRIQKLGNHDDFENDSAVKTLVNAAQYMLGRYKAIEVPQNEDLFPSWNRGFSLLANLHLNEHLSESEKQEIRDYFLVGTMDEARRWAFGEIEKISPLWLSSAEIAAVEGRIAVYRSAFGEGINLFKAVIEDDQALFFTYIDLLHDLGRAYQFTSYQQEGIDRFSEWEGWLRTSSEIGTSLLTVNIPENRYRLLYFIGRIEQQQKHYSESIRSFIEALKWTRDMNQQDACIWYILNAVLLENPAEILSYLWEYVPLWNDDVYFADIMDRVSQYMVSSEHWEGLLEVFDLIRGGNDGETTAKYAYIIARAIMEGYLSPKMVSGTDFIKTEIASAPVTFYPSSAKDFFRIAFEKSGQSFYYKALSASFLGEEVNPFGRTAHPLYDWPKSSHKENLEFLLGFFEYGADHFAYSYFRDLPLTINEQRITARHFIQAENWYDAIRVCSVFMNRKEYETQQDDLEMFYPMPYAELIERNARDNRIPPEVFFGLIRTESAFNKDAASWAGAVGLSQLMPETALDMAGRIARRGGPDYNVDGEIDLLNPEINIYIGAWYLRYLTDYTESVVLALAAYNGGMGRVRRWRAEKPHLPEDLFLETIAYAETRDYGRRVLGAAAAYGYLYYNLSMEAVIADIFTSRL